MIFHSRNETASPWSGNADVLQALNKKQKSEVEIIF